MSVAWRIASSVLSALLLAVSPAAAFQDGEPLIVRVAVVANQADGSIREHCEATLAVERQASHAWTFLTLGAEFPPLCGSPPPGSSPAEQDVAGAEPSTGSTRFAGRVEALVSRMMQDERVLTLRVDALSAPASANDPEQAGPPQQREFHFARPGTVYLPLAPGPAAVMAPDGLHELLLRLEVAEPPTDSEAHYGRILVEAAEGSSVVLDGGVAGVVPASGELLVDLVPAGWHELGIRSEGDEVARRAIRVRAGHTHVWLAGSGARDSLPFALQPLGANAQGYDEFRRPRDEAVLVRVPEGEFKMGNINTERSPFEHMVWLPGFLMDKTGVTWGQYKRFLSDSGLPLPPHRPFWGMHDDQPAVFVTWEESRAYCAWTGARLPTEAEREKAARGTDERLFPWGNEQPTPDRAVFRRSWGKEGPAAVGTHPAGASPYGLLDMGGNVWEWCEDWYSNDYFEISPYRDPRGPETGTARVVRGGSWDSRPSVLSASCRNWGHRGYRDGDFGFRCAMDAP